MRELGDGVWEAMQPELGRRVALRRLAPGRRFDAARWPDRPGVVRLYSVVVGDDGTYLATQFVPGARTLAELGGPRAGRRTRWLDEVAATLDGVVHGDLTEADVLVGADGKALVTGFGRAPEGATAQDDEAALIRLRAAGGRRARAAPVAALATAAAVLLAALVLTGDERPAAAPAPAVEPGATAIGSALAAGGVVTVDCEGLPPSGSSLPCTIVQTALPGRPVTAPVEGIVRRWVVRGARGRLRLRVLEDTPEGPVTVNRTRTEVADEPVEVFRSDRPVPAGARFALELAPGAGAGIHRGARGAVTARYFGPLRSAPNVTTTAGGRGEELLLRVDVVPRVEG